MAKCEVCFKQLTGKQNRFCGNICKNQTHQSYGAQQKRGKARRKQLIQIKGGKCQKCGYNKNSAALCFHHTKPQTKSFQISLRECSNNSWQTLLLEVDKCELLCSNCHLELHNPNYDRLNTD